MIFFYAFLLNDFNTLSTNSGQCNFRTPRYYNKFAHICVQNQLAEFSLIL